MPKVKRTGPTSEKPILIGFTAAAARKIERAAKLCDTNRTAFIRDASEAHAEKVIEQAGGK